MTKKGIDIDIAIKDMRPLDVILVRGTNWFSTLIAYTEATHLKCDLQDTFSHAGIIVSREIIDDELLEPGKLYLWESCLTHGVHSVHHPKKKFLGSQVRPLRETLLEYDRKSPNAFVGWLRYRNPRCVPIFDKDFRAMFTRFFNDNNNVVYDGNPFSLCGAVFRKLRPIAHMTQVLTHTERLMFCSELVAATLIRCRIIPSTVRPSYVLPQDFVGYDNELEPEMRIPKDLFEDVIFVTEFGVRLSRAPRVSTSDGLEDFSTD
jgi:hypothetical protein